MKRAIIIVIVNLLLVLTGIFAYHHFFVSKVAFIDANKVFEEFEMKKQLSVDFDNIESQRKLSLDSMALQLQMLEQKLNSGSKEKNLLQLYQYKAQEYGQRRKAIENANETLLEKYNSQIWTQLNQYVKEYGEQHHYDYVLGATGDGSIMYATSKNDITNEVIKYVNQQYNGK